MADIAVSSDSFRVVAVYVSNDQGERAYFFRQLGPFLVDLSRLVLMGNLNAILDAKIAGRWS